MDQKLWRRWWIISSVSWMDKFRYYYEVLLEKKLEPEGMTALCQRFTRLVVDEVVAAAAIPGAEAFLRRQMGKWLMFVDSATPEAEIREIVSRLNWREYSREAAEPPQEQERQPG